MSVNVSKTKGRLDEMGLSTDEGLAAAMLSREVMRFCVDAANKASEIGRKHKTPLRFEKLVPAMLVICLDFIDQDPAELKAGFNG